MKGVQCYELLGGIALKIHTFSFSYFAVFLIICASIFFALLTQFVLINNYFASCSVLFN